MAAKVTQEVMERVELLSSSDRPTPRLQSELEKLLRLLRSTHVAR